MEALHFVAGVQAQAGELLGRFHAFGGDGDAQRTAEVAEGLHDGPVVAAAGELGDEAAVDLDAVERVAAQVGQR